MQDDLSSIGLHKWYDPDVVARRAALCDAPRLSALENTSEYLAD